MTKKYDILAALAGPGSDLTEQARDALAEITQLRGNLSLAEDGLANYALEVQRLRDVLKRIAASHGASDHACFRRSLADIALSDEPAHEPNEYLSYVPSAQRYAEQYKMAVTNEWMRGWDACLAAHQVLGPAE